MADPVLIVGCRRNNGGTETACFQKVHSGQFTDIADGANMGTYNAFLRSERIAPAGAGGECLFTALLITARVTTQAISVQVYGYVDGVQLPIQTITFTPNPSDLGTASTGFRQEQRVDLSIPYIVGGVEQLRTAPRGAWFEVALIVNTPGPGWLEGVELEHEVVRSDQQGETR